MTKYYSSVDNAGVIRWYAKHENCISVLHRSDGPAIEYPCGTYKAWYINGRLHRTDGPALEDSGAVEYFLDGRRYEFAEWDRVRKLQAFK